MKYARDRCFVFYVWWLAKKLSHLSKGRVIYSHGEALGGQQTVLSPMSPTSTGKGKPCFHSFTTRRKVSFLHATFTTISSLSLKQILFSLQLSPTNAGRCWHSFTLSNPASLAEPIPSASSQAAPQVGVTQRLRCPQVCRGWGGSFIKQRLHWESQE